MTLQFMMQTYVQVYIMQKEWLKDLLLSISWYPLAVAFALYTGIIVISSACSQRIRKRPVVYVPLYILFSLLQAVIFVFAGLTIPEMYHRTPMLASAMSLTICVALSLYSCCLKETYQLRWGQGFSMIMLLGTAGTGIAIYRFKVDVVPSVLHKVLWALMIQVIAIEMQPTLQRTEGIFFAFSMQSNFVQLLSGCKRRCKRSMPSLDDSSYPAQTPSSDKESKLAITEHKKSNSDEDEESRCSNTSMILGESVHKAAQNESASSNAPLKSPVIVLPDKLETGLSQSAKKGRHRRRGSLEKQPQPRIQKKSNSGDASKAEMKLVNQRQASTPRLIKLESY